MMTASAQVSAEFRGLTLFENAVAELDARILNHPFVKRCGRGTATMPELSSFLIQHGRYSAYFTRYLCGLISQLDDGADVLTLADNLAEELGYGSESQTPHSKIYRRMLEDLGIALDQAPTFPETQNLIDTMLMLCQQPRGLAGLGALYLGAEAIVPSLYTKIMNGLRSCGVAEDRLEFFAMHVECDDKHAATMYAIIERMIDAAPASVLPIVSGGEAAVNARLRLFDALPRSAS